MACVGFVILIVLSIGFMGYIGVTSGQVSSADLEPFITDRVVEVKIVMSDEDWTTCQLDALEEQYVQADFWFDGELVPDVAVRPKGNSSLNSVYRSGDYRFSLKVDFNFFNSARTFRGLKKLNLNNGFNDPTFIREYLGYKVFEQMGIPAPRTAFVDLWVNDIHLGLYTQVEQVDVTFLARHFPDSDGNLYKPEPQAGFLNWTEDDLAEQRAKLGISEPEDTGILPEINMGGGKLEDIMQALDQDDEKEIVKAEPEPDQMKPYGEGLGMGAAPYNRNYAIGARDYIDQMGLKTNETYPDHTAILNLLEILNNEPDETFPEKIEKVLDVDSALRVFAVAGTIGYFDSYLGMGHNYYLYEVDGKFTLLPWDLNGAFGSFTCGMTRDEIINLCIDQPACRSADRYPLVNRLLAHEPYLKQYYQYLEELLNGPFSVETMTAQIEEAADLVLPYVQADELKFYPIEYFERGLYEDIPRWHEEKQPQEDSFSYPKIPPQKLGCIQNAFDETTLEELRTRRPTADELDKLKSCLTREEMATFLGHSPKQAGPTSGATLIGLKTFVVERSESIRKQLEGEFPYTCTEKNTDVDWQPPGPANGRPGGLPPRQ